MSNGPMRLRHSSVYSVTQNIVLYTSCASSTVGISTAVPILIIYNPGLTPSASYEGSQETYPPRLLACLWTFQFPNVIRASDLHDEHFYEQMNRDITFM